MLVAAVAIAVLAAAGLVGAAWWSWRADLDQARAIARDIAELTASETARMVEAARLVLHQTLTLASGTDWADPSRSQALTGQLIPLGEILAYMKGVFVFDAQGNLRATTMAAAPADFNVGDRSWFVAHRDDPQLGLGIVPLQEGWFDVGPLLALTRRASAVEGGFGGVISFGMEPSELRRFYQRPDRAFQSAFQLIGSDRLLLAQEPMAGDAFGRPIEARLADTIADASSGLVDLRLKDDVERIWAVHAVPNAPLYVAVGLSTPALRRAWLTKSLPGLSWSLLAVAALVALTLTAAQRARNEARYRVALRASDATRLRQQAQVQELNHRVRNNLQILTSLLSLQSRDPAGTTQSYLKETLRRVIAMGHVHELLSRSEGIVELDLTANLERLTEQLVRAYGADDRVDWRVSGSPVGATVDIALPLTLIASEAISNALKHGFPQPRRGTLAVHLDRRDGHLVLVVEDDGVGFDPAAPKRNGAMGLELIEALARQLNGEARITVTAGTRVVVDLPERQATAARTEPDRTR